MIQLIKIFQLNKLNSIIDKHGNFDIDCGKLRDQLKNAKDKAEVFAVRDALDDLDSELGILGNMRRYR